MEVSRSKAFLTAAECGTFSAAAERLHYTPSGVSQLVSALEQELDLTLLRRTQRGVFLTAAGETILPAIRAFLQQAERVEQVAAELNDLHRGSIVVASYPSMAMLYLPGVLREFQERYPNIRIQIREGERREQLAWLQNGEADLAFLGGDESLPGDWFPLAEDPMLVLLSKDHPMAGEPVFPLQRLRSEHFIMGGLGLDTDVVELLESHGVHPNVSLSMVSGVTVLAMVESGLGISVMNELVTKTYPFHGVKLPLEPPQTITLGILVPELDSAPPAVRRFLDFAVKRLTAPIKTQ